MFAVSYSLSPIINSYFQEAFRNHDAIMPLAGWGVAAGGVVNVSAALALAGGAMASGELDMWEAFFALVLGSGLGVLFRAISFACCGENARDESCYDNSACVCECDYRMGDFDS